MVNNFFIILLVIFQFSGAIYSQNQPSLEEILTAAEKQTVNYQDTFLNLLALESKTITTYDKNEQIKKQNSVESNFLVYRSSKNEKVSFELRNVLKVDGNPIPNSQENSDKFFAELNKTSTLKSELEKIQNTSSKYDKSLEILGLTLYEGIVLSREFRSSMEFQLLGKETLQGKEVYLVSYRQNKPSPNILINKKSADLNNSSLEFDVEIPSGFKSEDVFLQGKLWIDSSSFQIWREERELAVGSVEPVVLMKTLFDYQPSNYGILVPNKIDLWINQTKKKDGKLITVKNISVNYTYTNFRKTETDVKILDDTEN